MKRIKKYFIFLFFILLFTPFISVNAAKASCADVMDTVSELDSIESMYNQLDCDNTTEAKNKGQCNALKIEKVSALEKIYEYNDKKVCESIDLEPIISNQGLDCSNEFGSKLKDATNYVMTLFYISAPFILLIFGSLDFFKIIVGNDPNEIKKSRSNFFKRLIAFLLLYITPFFVKTIFSFTPYDMDGLSYVCAQEIDLSSDKTVGEVSGTYNGYSGGYSKAGSGDGQAIAEAAKEIKQHVVDHGYVWGCNGFGPVDQLAWAADKKKEICCAELIAPALLKAGIYDEADANAINDTFAAYVGTNLLSYGWEVIWNLDELQPGDVLLYQCLEGNCHITENLEGKNYRVGHIDIYYGEVDGKRKKVTTGGSFNQVLSNYYAGKYSTDSATMKLLCGLRYTGKK